MQDESSFFLGFGASTWQASACPLPNFSFEFIIDFRIARVNPNPVVGKSSATWTSNTTSMGSPHVNVTLFTDTHGVLDGSSDDVVNDGMLDGSSDGISDGTPDGIDDGTTQACT